MIVRIGNDFINMAYVSRFCIETSITEPAIEVVVDGALMLYYFETEDEMNAKISEMIAIG